MNFDQAAMAANDTTNEPEDITTEAPMWSQQAIATVTGAIILAITLEQQAVTSVEAVRALPSLSTYGADLITYCLAQLDESKHVIVAGDLIVPNAETWKLSAGIQLALAKEREDNLVTELTAHKERVQQEHALCQERAAAVQRLEAAKAGVQVAKEKLSEVEEEIAAFLMQGVQLTIPGIKSGKQKEEQTGNQSPYEAGWSAFDRGLSIGTCQLIEESPERASWENGWRMGLNEALRAPRGGEVRPLQ